MESSGTLLHKRNKRKRTKQGETEKGNEHEHEKENEKEKESNRGQCLRWTCIAKRMSCNLWLLGTTLAKRKAVGRVQKQILKIDISSIVSLIISESSRLSLRHTSHLLYGAILAYSKRVEANFKEARAFRTKLFMAGSEMYADKNLLPPAKRTLADTGKGSHVRAKKQKQKRQKKNVKDSDTMFKLTPEGGAFCSRFGCRLDTIHTNFEIIAVPLKGD